MSWIHSQQSNFVFIAPILLEDTVYIHYCYLFVYFFYNSLMQIYTIRNIKNELFY